MAVRLSRFLLVAFSYFFLAAARGFHEPGYQPWMFHDFPQLLSKRQTQTLVGSQNISKLGISETCENMLDYARFHVPEVHIWLCFGEYIPIMVVKKSRFFLGFGMTQMTWVWVNTYRYIFSGMNIHLPAILGFTRYQGFDPSPFDFGLHIVTSQWMQAVFTTHMFSAHMT